jgi:hypothetical protein
MRQAACRGGRGRPSNAQDGAGPLEHGLKACLTCVLAAATGLGRLLGVNTHDDVGGCGYAAGCPPGPTGPGIQRLWTARLLDAVPR